MQTGGITIFFKWLFLLSAIWPTVVMCSVNTTGAGEFQVVESCSIKIANFENVQKQFKYYTKLRKARIVDFKLSGIEWADSSNETIEVFDPNWWSWVATSGEYLTLMPIDFKILSFGLSWYVIRDMDVHFTSTPFGCVHNLTFEQQRRFVVNEILSLTVNEHGSDDLICRSTYSRRSITTGNLVGVGKTCDARSRLRPASGDDSNLEQKTDYGVEGFEIKSAAITTCVFTLSLIVMSYAIYWRWHIHVHCSYTIKDSLTHKSERWELFRLPSMENRRNAAQPSGSGGDEAMLPGDVLLMTREDELAPYEGPVSLRDLLDSNMCRDPCGRRKKLSFLFLLQFIPIFAWMLLYSYMGETIRRLDSTEKIVFNLLCNPYSWFFTDKLFGLHYFATVMVSLNLSFVILLVLAWLLELRCARQYIVANVSSKTKQIVFDIFFVTTIIFIYIPVYAIVNSIIYIIAGVIAGIDIVFPWVTAGLLAVYYIQRSYRDVIETYTDIKHVMLKACYSEKASRATHVGNVQVTTGYNDQQIDMGLKQKVLQEPVLFVCDPSKQSNDDQCSNSAILKHQVLVCKKTLLCTCKTIEPFPTFIKWAFVKLVFTLVFLFLVAFIMSVLHANPSTGVARFVVTSFPALLTAFLRWLFESMTTDAEKKIRKLSVAKKVRELLPRLTSAEFTQVADIRDEYVIQGKQRRKWKCWKPNVNFNAFMCGVCRRITKNWFMMFFVISLLAFLCFMAYTFFYIGGPGA